MNNYTPFLKLKQNEVMALKELDVVLKKSIIPFFDFPKETDMTEDNFKDKTKKLKKQVSTHLSDFTNFYLDNFDVDTQLTVNGKSNYEYLLQEFNKLQIIPVVGIDRSSEHIDAVINAKKDGVIIEDRIAIRLTAEDFSDFELVIDDITDALDEVIDLFEYIELVFDCRMCANQNIDVLSSNIIEFAKSFSSEYKVSKIIVTGSSIPVMISDLIGTNDEKNVSRNELYISTKVIEELTDDIFFGDYTIVSPDYSDSDIPGNYMMNVMSPKTIYSFEKNHFVIRGGAVKTHARGLCL